jgi:hypothetical protein
MNRREKILAVALGIMAALTVAWYLSMRVVGAFQSRRNAIEGLQQEIERKEAVIRSGQQAAARIAEMEARSLPPASDKARSLYQAWLIDLAVRDVGLQNVNLRANETTKVGDVYEAHRFVLNCDGNIEQLVKLLHAFYQRDMMHRIDLLRVQPVDGSKLMQLTLAVQAVSLPGAPDRIVLPDGKSSRLAYGELAAYTDKIVGRNLFAPPNQPPQFGRVGSQRANTGRPFSLALSATDRDPLDNVKFELVGEAPRGLRMAPGTGGKTQLSWTPRSTGQYEVTVRAIDDGFPAKSTSQTIQITVTEPAPRVVVRDEDRPPPRPQFDLATQTVLTSVVDVSGHSEARLLVRPTGERVFLREGDRFTVGTVQGVVNEIGLRDMVVEIDGKLTQLFLGDRLVDGVVLPAGGR